MYIRVLGAAAGGGYPQWNCNHPNSRRARQDDPAAPQRTQSSIAVSADAEMTGTCSTRHRTCASRSTTTTYCTPERTCVTARSWARC